ncbi:hypothetical protein KDH_77760 [Dictyobacter sp. S3.2.2.5]|uniref:Uncharacterized protein n=1 Tax=Dictyobacter halimunensis TaxID=3026934 RepID=A0ABQ6G6N1_9CHLR|nr:hypothetical protein KDH_77760 [Dictyobacter sp. S3.2.2.5]
MLMKKATHCEEAGTTFAAIVELADEDLANVVAGAGYAADLFDEDDLASGGVPYGQISGGVAYGYGQMHRQMHRRLRRRAATRRLLSRSRQSRMSSTTVSP